MAQWLRPALTLRNLHAGFERVAVNQGQAGVDHQGIDDFAARLDANLRELRVQVLTQRYQPQPLLRVWLPRPGKAPRPLGIPTVRDRTLHAALALALNPVLEAEFEDCSYAYRQGRSVRMAVERIGVLQRAGYRWVVEADIEHFFDRIPHAPLLAELHTLVPDDDLVQLVGQILCAPVQDGQRLQPNRLGVPQGSPLSPLLANLYLDHLDETLLDDDLALVRYADDFVILTRSEQRAQQALELTAATLTDLHLRLNPRKTRIVHMDQGFDFLGWTFVRSVAVPAGPAAAGDASAAPASATNASPQPLAPAEPPGEMALALQQALQTQPDWQPLPPACPENPAETTPALPSSDALLQALALEDTSPLLAPSPTATDLDLTPEHLADAPPEPTPDTAPSADEAAGPPRGRAVDAPPLQRTLYITDVSVTLATDNQHLVVRRGQDTLLSLPALNVDLVVLLGRIAVTPAAWVCCAQHDVPVALLSRLGRFYGCFEPAAHARRALLAAQFRAIYSAALDLPLAREMVRGKLSNSALILRSYARARPSGLPATQDPAHQTQLTLRDLAYRTRSATSLDILRGLEGAGAAAYFAVWRGWLGPDWGFGARQQRTGADRINALLDLGYTLLYQACAGLIQARGLDPWVGHLHRGNAGHMALASDLMEEFRALVVDAVVLDACLNRHLLPGDFIASGDGFVLRPPKVRWFIGQFEQRLNVARRHPQTGEPLDMRRIMDAQIRALAHSYRNPQAPSYRACTFR